MTGLNRQAAFEVMAIDRNRQGLSLSIQLQIEMNKPENLSLRSDAIRSERIITLKRDAQHPDSPWLKPTVAASASKN